MKNTITSKGQVTVPKEIRLRAKIKPGTNAYQWSYDSEREQIVFKVSSGNITQQLAGCMQSSRPYIPYDKVRALAGHSLGEKYADQ